MAKTLSGLESAFDSPDYEYSAQRSKIARKQALAQALTGQGMQSLETNRMAGGWAIPISPFEGAAKLAQTYVGSKAAASAEKEQTDLAKQSRADYGRVLAQVMTQTETDPVAAMGTLSQHPRGAELMPLVMQNYQRQQLIKALGGGAGGSPAAPQGPQPGEGAGYGVVAPGTPQQPAQPSLGGPAGGIPIGAWLAADPTGKSYLEAYSHGNEALGGVQYDQSGKAFVTNKQGGVQYLPGITARDKNELVDTDGAIQPVNPYNPGGPIQKSLTPMQNIQGPIEQQGAAIKADQYNYETGRTPPPLRPIQPQQPQPIAPAPAQPPIAPQVRALPSAAAAPPQGVPRAPASNSPYPQVGVSPKM